MDDTFYISLLKKELIPALGCTEPIAIALAAARARKVLGKEPDSVEIVCSGNVIKNAKSVTVPRTRGLVGIEAAAIAGIVAGDPDRDLEVLEPVQDQDLRRIKILLDNGLCRVSLAKDVENLFILAIVKAGDDVAEVTISGSHSNVARVALNGEEKLDWASNAEPLKKSDNDSASINSKDDERSKTEMNLKEIFEFAGSVDLDNVRDIIARQVDMNMRISEEGLRGEYGASVGKTLLATRGDDLRTRAKAWAAAGSDARMSGSTLPVVINSGSGNQGITVSLPVIIYANELGVSKDRLYRALALSNLISIYLKSKIGKLSAFCGAVSAACGCGAGITFLYGVEYSEISKTIKNTLANVSGMVCDGAKPSCAAKISSAVDAAILAHDLAVNGRGFGGGEGLIDDDIEKTLANIGHLGKIGMRDTDEEILKIMISAPER